MEMFFYGIICTSIIFFISTEYSCYRIKREARKTAEPHYVYKSLTVTDVNDATFIKNTYDNGWEYYDEYKTKNGLILILRREEEKK